MYVYGIDWICIVVLFVLLMLLLLSRFVSLSSGRMTLCIDK